jgi:hypothetical protein
LSTCRLILFYLFRNDKIDHCAYIHERDELGNTPLHIAASNGHDRVVQCLLDHGANHFLKNVYDNTPLQVSKNETCRQVIRKAAEYGVNEENSARMYQAQIGIYQEKIRDVEMTIQNIHSCENLCQNDYEAMERLVSEAKLIGLPHETVQKGSMCLEWMYTRASLVSALETTNHKSPIDNDQKLECVNNLLNLIEEIERKIKDTENSQTLVKVPDFITLIHQNALLIYQKSMSEYELSLVFNRLQSIQLVDANHCDEADVMKLQKAIETSIAQNADASFVQLASTLLDKLTRELDLLVFLEDAPNVKLPVPDMTAKEATSYWEPRKDIGYLDENDGCYPLPHSDNGYVWIKSECLQSLESYLELLNEKIQNASQFGVNSKLLDSAKGAQTDKQNDLKLLLEKNESDRLAAITIAEKVAKKQKKKKKSVKL